MSNRIEKVNSLLESEISKILLKDFDFSDVMVTLTHVEAIANLIEAKAYISILPEDKSEKIIKILNREVKSVQQKINKMLNMRPIPKIIFVKDSQVAEASRVEKLLGSLKKEEN